MRTADGNGLRKSSKAFSPACHPKAPILDLSWFSIDALDECGEGPAKSLLVYFKDLICQAKNGPSHFKICISSRHYPILTLDTIPSIKVARLND